MRTGVRAYFALFHDNTCDESLHYHNSNNNNHNHNENDNIYGGVIQWWNPYNHPSFYVHTNLCLVQWNYEYCVNLFIVVCVAHFTFTSSSLASLSSLHLIACFLFNIIVVVSRLLTSYSPLYFLAVFCSYVFSSCYSLFVFACCFEILVPFYHFHTSLPPCHVFMYGCMLCVCTFCKICWLVWLLAKHVCHTKCARIFLLCHFYFFGL